MWLDWKVEFAAARWWPTGREMSAQPLLYVAGNTFSALRGWFLLDLFGWFFKKRKLPFLRVIFFFSFFFFFFLGPECWDIPWVVSSHRTCFFGRPPFITIHSSAYVLSCLLSWFDAFSRRVLGCFPCSRFRLAGSCSLLFINQNLSLD